MNQYGVDTTINGYKLICTCGSCPEQYEVFDANDNQVGFLRLRWNHFVAKCGPEGAKHGGEIVYMSHPEGFGDFDSQEERDTELSAAINSIDKYLMAATI